MAQLKVLVLHGYGQTAADFEKKSGAIRKSLGKHFELVYLEAPHAVTNLKGEPGKAWWTFEGDFFTAPDYIGVAASIELVKQQTPFVGVVGFSQGAAFAGFLGALFPVAFTVLIGGYPVSDARYRLYEQIASPSIHVYGEADELVLPARSRELHALSKGATHLIAHPGRHVVPNVRYPIPGL